ncbi:hopene-associated glycosyltransferase HpnB [Sphingomonas vulcanisoli]|uniref:Hopene-associated glycosyltransferase HpnB n=1 Tax=Sphingomonas vulcanisoli TaxID=1658060 RepID=A0ABX0TTN6_9SPHN|nr:glycosyltransferase [Sphingomonas vulcanisoli]NIJ07850.1 hopene-associated glycosyltransferase HpnB [Sphingomonas vulcanisoli]
MIWLAVLALAVWIGLLAARNGFWLARERDEALFPVPVHWPKVTAIVPARDEADVIARAIGSIAAQDYPGDLQIILVDDGSSDGTAEIARSLGAPNLRILPGTPLPRGWTGKLWAMEQGRIAAGEDPQYLWFTDADIVHAPDTLRMLTSRAVAERLTLHTLMAELRCDSPAERALVPAFVFFFQMLYPFAAVNRPASRIAGAAGGCMLADRAALARVGGLQTIAAALIDDCAMGRAMKRQGPIRLSLTRRSVSIRPYGGWRDIGRMIARSAYAQLGYSPLALAGTLIGMALIYLAPPALTLFAHGLPRWLGLAAWALMALSFQPMLRFYRRSPLWGWALPSIAAFYAGATFVSAWDHWRGKGGMWKGRAQAQLQP